MENAALEAAPAHCRPLPSPPSPFPAASTTQRDSTHTAAEAGRQGCSAGLAKGGCVDVCDELVQPALEPLMATSSFLSCDTKQPSSPPPQDRNRDVRHSTEIYTTAGSMAAVGPNDEEGTQCTYAAAAAAAAAEVHTTESPQPECAQPLSQPPNHVHQQAANGTLAIPQQQQPSSIGVPHATILGAPPSTTKREAIHNSGAVITGDRGSQATTTTMMSSRTSEHMEAVKEAAHKMQHDEANKVGLDTTTEDPCPCCLSDARLLCWLAPFRRLSGIGRAGACVVCTFWACALQQVC
jgi:hypothetical protein